MVGRLSSTQGDEFVIVSRGLNQYEISPAQLAVLMADYIAEQSQGALASTALQPGDATTELSKLITSGAGAPDDATQATLSRNPTGDDNALTFTSVAYGTGANSITIEYVDPSANDAELSVDVTASAITVNLATGVAGAITSTAADVLAAIEASTPAAALVTVAINTSDSGSADDGSGIVTALASAPMTGGAGTAIGTVDPGGLYIDTTGAQPYRNDGTAAVPVWVALADAA